MLLSNHIIYFFSYVIENGVCYLTLTEKMFPSRLAFGFLEDIAKEFWKQYSSEIPTVVRPYSFIEFGGLLDVTFLQYKFV